MNKIKFFVCVVQHLDVKMHRRIGAFLLTNLTSALDGRVYSASQPDLLIGRESANKPTVYMCVCVYVYTYIVQTGPGAHPASCTLGTRSFPGVKAAGA
jgi:hypothetical protein